MRTTPTLLVLLLVALCQPSVGTAQPLSLKNTPVIGGPCQGCEFVFQGLPSSLASETRIAPPEEPGEPLVLAGIVRDASGAPAAGIVVYAYHTNAKGVYPKDTTFHGRLRGWARTDSDGRYRFTTIRPAGYPDGAECAHIHMHVIEPGVGTYYIDNVTFDDDPDLPQRLREQAINGRGGSGLTYPKRTDGVWHVQRDITLGQNIPNYPVSSENTVTGGRNRR